MFSNIGDSNLKHIFGGLDNWHILSEDRNAICYTKQQFSQSFVMNLESLKKILYLDFCVVKRNNSKSANTSILRTFYIEIISTVYRS